MKNLPLISIIIPSFNKVDYISETLKSIIDQNYPDLEVIIQDPGSTDGSLDIIKLYEKKYPKIFRLFNEKDKGQLDAINIGLSKAKGDILTYINADDVYEKGALRVVGEYFSKHPETLWLAGNGRVIDKNGKEISGWVTTYKNLLLNLKSYILLLVVNYLIQPSVFLNKSAWEKYGPFKGDTKFIMEYEMWLRMGKDQMPMVSNKTLSSFRIPEKSISRNEFEKTLDADLNIVKQYTNNSLILFFHHLHNLGRKFVVKSI